MAIDTLQVSKNLIKAGFNAKMAEAMASELKGTEDNFLDKKDAEEKLATKADLNALESRTKDTINDLRQETKDSINGLRIEMSDMSHKIIFWVAGLVISGFIGLVFFMVEFIMV